MDPSLYLNRRIVNRIGLCLLAVAVFLAAPAVRAADQWAREKAEKAQRDRIELEESLEILARGDAASRRKVAANACSSFEALDSVSYGEEELNRIVEALRRYLRHEEDDWIASRLIEEIGCQDFHVLRPLFLDALAGPSPNLRWRVFQHLRWVEEPEAVPLLEGAWPRENRPWARVDLIRALAWNHSTRFLEEFRSLAEGDDPELSSAAIGAIILLDDQESLPLLARLAREGTESQRREAADALSLMPESPVALAALLDATDDEDSKTRRCAVRSLGKRGDPVALARVLAVSFTDPDEDVRKAGLASLDGSSWQALFPEILKRVPDDPEAKRDVIEDRILRVVGHLPSRASRPNVTWPRKPREDGREPWCTYQPPVWLVPENPRSMRASPPRGRASVRCFEFPAVSGDPQWFWRVRRGALVFVRDHFEGRDGSWVNVHGFEVSRFCWLPADQVVPASAENPPEEEEGILQREFDLPAEDLRDPYFIDLKQAKMVKVIESEDQIATVSLRIRLGVPEDEALVRRSLAFSGSLTSTNVLEAVTDAYDRLCGYPAMMAVSAELGQVIRSCPDASRDEGEQQEPP
jgi:HEAT repeat protein